MGSLPTSTSTVLVTGAAGFIGSHLVEELTERGYRVLCLDNFDDYYAPEIKRANLALALGAGAAFWETDIRDQAALFERLDGETVDAVVHLAARPGVRPSLEDPDLYVDVNVKGTLNLLQVCRRLGIQRFLFASSSSVYGAVEDTAIEDATICRPLSPYGATKLAGEALCSPFAETGIDTVCLRFFTVYGPRQRPDMAINRFTRIIAEGGEVPIYGDGHSRRDYTFVSDTVAGIVAALEAAPGGFQVFNLGRGQPVTLLDMVRLIEQNLGIQAKLRFLPTPPGEPQSTFADISKARAVLGYEPQVSFDEGIRTFVGWFVENNSGNLAASRS